jgi:hypothetical protein
MITARPANSSAAVDINPALPSSHARSELEVVNLSAATSTVSAEQ